MIKRLEIENIALVDHAVIEFERGLSTLTGETGGGKSVVVTSLALALGARADREYVRHGAEQARIVAQFSLEDIPITARRRLPERLRACEEFTVERVVTASGQSRAKLDGENITVGELRELTTDIAEILSQHASQRLMDDTNHLIFLDRFAGLESEVAQLAERYHAWQQSATRLRQLQRQREQLINERELLSFQRQEIEQAELRAGEEIELESERRRLDSARELMSGAAAIQQLLGGEDNSVSMMLGTARRELAVMARLDDRLADKLRTLQSAELEIEELRRDMEQYGASIEDDPQRLDQINERLTEIYRLKKKYGNTEQAVLDHLERISHELDTSLPPDDHIARLTTETAQQLDHYAELARAVSTKREKAAETLRRAVLSQLPDLAIDNGDFICEFIRQSGTDPSIEFMGDSVTFGENGLEQARFLFTANPGEPLKSLSKTASGGELSRVLLALKLAEKQQRTGGCGLMVFDEIDTGIGGRTALALAEKLKELSGQAQVMVITHLHQIARLADHHYVADKIAAPDGRTLIKVERLSGERINREIDRMLAIVEE
jgi:DNA repair protein RecN (Recombination protein N)